SHKDVEGSLFVVKRRKCTAAVSAYYDESAEYSADNLAENLLGDFEFEIQVPDLLYRNDSQEVYGIWFYNFASL
ncbi:unnamed protein product, partial [Linum tenue]